MGNPDPQPLPYADAKLPIGPTGFRSLGGYASDGADPYGGRMQDDGTCLSLLPSRAFNVRLITYTTIGLVWAIGLFIYIPAYRRPTTPLWTSRVCVGTFVTFALLVMGACLQRSSHDRRPFIIVDRKKQRILLPRSQRSFSFAQVFRLQLICFSRAGALTEATGTGKKPLDGELQILLGESGQEQPWCVVSGLDARVAKQFSVAFRQITAIPVSRAIYHPALGEWEVEPFDGDWDGSALASLDGPTAR